VNSNSITNFKVKLFPVIELMDIYYAYKYSWLHGLLEVSNGIMLRPEPKLGEAFRHGLSIKDYLSKQHGVPIDCILSLEIMLDHGIFISSNEFRKIFGVDKKPETLVDVYSVLRINYGLAYDVPSRLHVEIAISIAIAKLLNRELRNRLQRAIYMTMRPVVENVAEILLSYVKEKDLGLGDEKLSINSLKLKIYKIINTENAPQDLRDALYVLSDLSVKETLRNLERQLRYKSARYDRTAFTLVPVIQGLYEDHAKECLHEALDLLRAYEEYLKENGKKYFYIAIGTGGRVLSANEAKLINKLLEYGHDYARRMGSDVRFHILGWSSPRLTKILRLDLVYSSDSLSARRRAVEGKVYALTNSDKIRLLKVSEIDPNLWKCPCPVCRNEVLRQYVLDPSGKRRNDARIVHNVWVLKEFISKLLNSKYGQQ